MESNPHLDHPLTNPFGRSNLESMESKPHWEHFTNPFGSSSFESEESNPELDHPLVHPRFSFDYDDDARSLQSFDSLDPFGEARDAREADEGESVIIGGAQEPDERDSEALLAQTLYEERRQARIRAAAEWFACAPRHSLAPGQTQTQQRRVPKQETKHAWKPEWMSPRPKLGSRVKTAVKNVFSRPKKDDPGRGGYAGL